MTHLDEGTIHAWLDGALIDAEARAASEHVASCAECSAKVAEARGFIAGASRVLNSLDDVPAGIAPKRTAVSATGKSPARPFWQAAPWVTSIAAALMLAIGVKEWRDRPSAQTSFAPVDRLAMDSLRAAPAESKPVDSALRQQSAAAPAVQPIVRRPASILPSPSTRIRADRRQADVAGSASGAGVPSVAAEAAAPRIEDIPKAIVGDVSNGELRLVGCYRIGTVVALERLPARAMAKAVSDRSKEPSAKSSLASAADVAPEFVAPAVLRLDTTLTAAGRVIRLVTTGTVLGTWFAAGGDSVRLVFPAAGPLVLPTSARVACEQKP